MSPKIHASNHRRFSIRIIALTALLSLGAAAGSAHAGYYDIYGGYHPTCVPGYWAFGPMGRFWVAPVCR